MPTLPFSNSMISPFLESANAEFGFLNASAIAGSFSIWYPVTNSLFRTYRPYSILTVYIRSMVAPTIDKPSNVATFGSITEKLLTKFICKFFTFFRRREENSLNDSPLNWRVGVLLWLQRKCLTIIIWYTGDTIIITWNAIYQRRIRYWKEGGVMDSIWVNCIILSF